MWTVKNFTCFLAKDERGHFVTFAIFSVCVCVRGWSVEEEKEKVRNANKNKRLRRRRPTILRMGKDKITAFSTVNYR